MIAAFFDIDRTLMAGASALKLARPLRKHGLLTRRSQVRAAVVQLGFMRRGAGTQSIERFQETAYELIKGWNGEQVRNIVADEVERSLRPMVFKEALERIEMHHRQGHKVYAVSATLHDIAAPFAEFFGLDGAVGSEAELDADGCYTGNIAVFCHGEAKGERVAHLAREQDIDLTKSFAYSDSISDESMLRAVAKPYAVNPDAKLRLLAEQEGWGILQFRNRVVAPMHQHRAVRFGALAAVAAVVAGSVQRRRR